MVEGRESALADISLSRKYYWLWRSSLVCLILNLGLRLGGKLNQIYDGLEQGLCRQRIPYLVEYVEETSSYLYEVEGRKFVALYPLRRVQLPLAYGDCYESGENSTVSISSEQS